MKMTVVTIALCTALTSLCAVPIPADVTAETLEPSMLHIPIG